MKKKTIEILEQILIVVTASVSIAVLIIAGIGLSYIC